MHCNEQRVRTDKLLRVLLSVPMQRADKRGLPINAVEALNDAGLGYIAAACKQAGIDVTLFGWNVDYDLQTFRAKLLEWRPDVVGLKVFTTDFRAARDTLSCVREVLPGAITVIGGPHPSTSRPEDIFAEFGGLLDFAIAGDGEQGIAELLGLIAAAGGKPTAAAVAHVPGLVYTNEGKAHANAPRLDANLDGLAPMDWSLQQPQWFGTAHGLDNASLGALIMDSRGCPGRCAFCLCGRINGAAPRRLGLGRLCAEIEKLVTSYGVRSLVFTGNSFMSDVEYVRELCRWLISRRLGVQWSCTGSYYVRHLKEKGMLPLMRAAGCSLIYFGIESGNPDVRKRLTQPTTLEEIAEIVRLTTETGIRARGYFMFGFPDETVQEMDDTIRFAFSLPFDRIGFAVCLPLPGTLSYYAVLRQRSIERIDWGRYDFRRPKLLPCKATPWQVQLKIMQTRILKKSGFVRRLYGLVQGEPGDASTGAQMRQQD